MTLQIELLNLPRLRMFGNTKSPELMSSIPIVKGGTTLKPQVVMSLDIGPQKAGTMIFATCEYQVTHNYTYNCMVGSYLTLASSPALGGVEINERMATNITSAIHHLRQTRVGWWVGWSDMATAYLNLVLYAAASGALSGHKMTVDKDYGRLAAMVASAS